MGASGKAQTIDVPASDATLAGLAAAINSSGVGVTANVLTDSSGSRLSLVSGTSGAKGTIIVDSTSNSIVDKTNSNAALGYTASVATPADAQLTVDNMDMSSASNTVTGLIPGLTFQLLSPSAKESDGSLQSIQVVIGNDNTDVASTINTMVSDYNSLVSAMNAQEGNDSSGNPEPLFGSPTLSLLQQQLLGSLNTQNPNGYLDSIATNTGTTLAGSISIAVGSGKTQNDRDRRCAVALRRPIRFTPAPQNNTLQGLADTINAAAAGTTMSLYRHGGHRHCAVHRHSDCDPRRQPCVVRLHFHPGGQRHTRNFVIGDTPSTGAAANTTYLGDSTITLSDLATQSHSADIGVSATVFMPAGGAGPLVHFWNHGDGGDFEYNFGACGRRHRGLSNVVTQGTNSSLTLLSQTAGSSGALTTKSELPPQARRS